MTAGIYASRQKLNVLMVTKSFGGQMAEKAVSIENYPGFQEISGKELIANFEKHLRKQEINIENDSVVEIKKEKEIFLILTEGRKQFQARAVLITSGTDPRRLEVLGEKELIGKGVSYCVTCDGPLFKGKDIAVIGGGNAGFEAAIFMTGYAKKVYLLEAGSDVKADLINQEKARDLRIEVIINAKLKEIQGDNFVESLSYQDKEGTIKKLKAGGVFIEIGYMPATSFIKGLVDFNEKDEIIVDPRTNETKTPGLFAAGDVTDIRYKQIVIAAGDGAKAALAIYGFLSKQK